MAAGPGRCDAVHGRYAAESVPLVMSDFLAHRHLEPNGCHGFWTYVLPRRAPRACGRSGLGSTYLKTDSWICASRCTTCFGNFTEPRNEVSP